MSVRRDVSAGTHVRDLWNHFFTLMGGREWTTVGDDLLVGILFVIGIILVVTWRPQLMLRDRMERLAVKADLLEHLLLCSKRGRENIFGS